MRILVTGGAGFIGSALIRSFLKAGEIEIVNVDCLTYAGNLESLNTCSGSLRYNLRKTDIRHFEEVRQVFSEFQPESVIHLAAESHVDRSIDGPAEFIQTNIVGTYNLLEAAREYWSELSGQSGERFRFLHISTDEVYGSLGTSGLFTENSPSRPSSPYAASKAASDNLVRAWYQTYGLPVITTNCSNNYGPYQFPEKLIPLVVLNALEGKTLPIYGTGENVRDWLYVEDHVSALKTVLNKGEVGETYNVGGGCEMTNREVVESICVILDELVPDFQYKPYASLITYVKDRPGHDKRYAIDASKIKRELGWKPIENFESGLKKTVRWYLENNEWCKHVLDGSYRRERLGLTSG